MTLDAHYKHILTLRAAGATHMEFNEAGALTLVIFDPVPVDAVSSTVVAPAPVSAKPANTVLAIEQSKPRGKIPAISPWRGDELSWLRLRLEEYQDAFDAHASGRGDPEVDPQLRVLGDIICDLNMRIDEVEATV